jgi:hypothetical protein
MDAVMPHYSEDTPTHTPANQVGHAHSHSSQSGKPRPLTLQPIRWVTPFYATVNIWDNPYPVGEVGNALLRYSQQLGHSHSSQSGGVRRFTLQSRAGTLTLQPIRLDAPFYATIKSWDTHTPANQVGCAVLRCNQELGHSHSS